MAFAPSLLVAARVTDGGRGGKRVGAMMDRFDSLEERVAHLMRAVEDLSDVVARQGRDLDRLLRLTQMLAEREAGRESDGTGGIPLADQKPPHW
jgi:SlyX protein